MRDINNLIDNLTYSEKYVVEWLIGQLIKSSGYKIKFNTKESASSVGICESTVRSAIKKLSIAEVVKYEKEKDLYVVYVTGRTTFHALVKIMGAR